MTDRDIERFSIDKFIIKASNMDWLGLNIYVQEQIGWLQKMKFPNKTQEERYLSSMQIQYLRFLLGFADLLTTGTKPHMDEFDFQKTKPIIQNLIEKGNWIKSSIDIYN